MTQYSASGYAIAVKLRTQKTLLVEGHSDKFFLERLIAEKIEPEKEKKCLIDTAEIIKSDIENNIVSNKQKVIYSSNLINNRKKFKWLVDREWDNINILDLSDLKEPPDDENLTKGHSIENYLFTENSILNYVKNHHFEKINSTIINQIVERFKQTLIFSLCFSLVAKDTNQITKVDGILSFNFLEWKNQKWILNSDFDRNLISRNGIGISEKINEMQKDNNIKSIGINLSQWLIHGHIGEHCIRSCLAKIFNENGISSEICLDIERGHKKEKMRTDASFLCKIPEEGISPINKIIDWALS